MPYKRIYLKQPLSVGQQVSTGKDTAHYLATVLRCRVGDGVLLFDGSGESYAAEIQAITRQSVSLSVTACIPAVKSPAIDITLACAIAKGPRMDYAVQKAVELGVNHIVPLFTARGVVKLTKARISNRHAHWQKIIIHACEQSGRSDLPGLSLPQSLESWLTATRPADNDTKKIIFSLQSKRFLPANGATPSSCIVLLGPEGDFSAEEERLARHAGYEAISLGPRVLRTETAVAAALTTVQVFWGDMRAENSPPER